MYKLCYFNLRGIAETTRIMFHLAGQEYEDYRYPIDLTNFSKPEYDADKEAGQFTISLDRLPILIVDNKFKLGESKAIERYIAKKCGFMGKNEEEEAFIDMVCEHVRDIETRYKTLNSRDLEKKRATLQVEIPVWLSKMEKVVDSESYSVGDKISLADIVIHQFLFNYFEGKDILKDFTKMRGIVETVNQAASEWFETRPVTPK